jgi:hypothetical protein
VIEADGEGRSVRGRHDERKEGEMGRWSFATSAQATASSLLSFR